MVLLTFGIILVQLLFEYRISLRMVHQKLISPKAMTKIGTVSILCTTFVVFFWSKNFLALLIFGLLKILSFQLGLFLLRYHRERIFRLRFCETLTKIILKMKTGVSFRQAINLVANETDAFTQQKVRKIVDVVTFSQQIDEKNRSTFFGEIVDEFKSIDNHPHKGLVLLKNFQRKLKTENDFRRRSGQVTRQIRAQAYLLTGLYLATFFFVVIQYGAGRHLNLLTISVLIFLIGLIWIIFGGRKSKWKV